jgi:hypothetical protein
MTTHYLEISAVGQPLQAGKDENERHVLTFNLNIWKHPSATLTEELVALLQAAGVGTWESNIFNMAAPLPNGNGPYLLVRETTGAAPLRTMNEVQPPASTRPNAQIVVHGRSFTAARTMSHAAHAALDGVRNTDVTPITP